MNMPMAGSRTAQHFPIECGVEHNRNKTNKLKRTANGNEMRRKNVNQKKKNESYLDDFSAEIFEWFFSLDVYITKTNCENRDIVNTKQQINTFCVTE